MIRNSILCDFKYAGSVLNLLFNEDSNISLGGISEKVGDLN